MFLPHMSRIVFSILIIAAMFILTACGGGDEDSVTIPMPPDIDVVQPDPQPEPELEPEPEARPLPLPAVPILTAKDAQQSPVFYEGTTLHIGTDISPESSLQPVTERPGMFYGQLRDGEGAESVSSYMAEFAAIGEFKAFEGVKSLLTLPQST